MTVAFSLSIAGLMSLMCIGMIWYAHRSAERRADRMLRVEAQGIESEFASRKGPRDVRSVIEEEGRDLRAEDLTIAVLPRNDHTGQRQQNGALARRLARQDGWRTTSVRLGRDTVLIGIPWRRTETELRFHAVLLLSVAAFVVLLAAAGAWVLVGRTLSPIASLSRQADTASVDSLRVRLEEPSDDSEIVGLVATLNGLLARLSETAAAKGRFYSAASHELRTPLQALSGHLELALTADRTNGEYKAAVEEAYKQTRRVISLVRDLLLLYQLEAAAPTPTCEPGNLASVCQEVLHQYQPLIERRGLRVEGHLPADAAFFAPPTHMEVLVRNLIENAVRYADQGGEITVDLSPHSGAIALVVFNQFSPKPGWDADRLFEPFGRLDSSRSPKTGGTGLGLAICKAVAHANQWKLTLQQDPDGVRATLVVPAMNAGCTASANAGQGAG
jgi:signal transduction histidine kinase